MNKSSFRFIAVTIAESLADRLSYIISTHGKDLNPDNDVKTAWPSGHCEFHPAVTMSSVPEL